MSFQLDALKNTSRPYKRRKVVGRGPGSGRGKTCCRGHKGQGSRSGSGLRQGYVGGGVPLHRRIPTRGFTRGRFLKRLDVINLGQIDAMYADGETVSVETLRQKGYLSGPSHGVKVLGDGELKKKVTFQVEAMSNPAKEKLKAAEILQ